MPNRFGRSVGEVAAFKPRPLLPEGLLPVARPTGSSDKEVAAAAAGVADSFNRFADEAATLEGDRAGKVAGTDPNYRPEGRTTLRGRAFEASATSTYLDQLEANMRTDMQRVFEANRNDPAALSKAFDVLGQEYHAKHVFPEVRGKFDAEFTKLRLPFQNKALSNQDALVRDNERASVLQNITASQDSLSRLAATNPNDPNTVDAVRSELTRLDAVIDTAVKNESISAEAAVKIKAANRDSITTRAVMAVADEFKSAADVDAYRQNVKKKYGAGELKDLSADGYDRLDASLEARSRALRATANHGEALLQKNVNDYVDRAKDGLVMSEAEWTAFAASDAAKTDRGKGILALGEAKVKVASAMRNMSVQDADRYVARLRAGANKDGANTAQGEIIDFATQLVDEQRKALNTDQLGLAEQKRIVTGIAPLDFQAFAASDDPNAAGALAVQFRNRTAQARAVGSSFQRAPQFLRPEEKARLKEIVDQGGDKALALAGAIVKGADSDAPNILREISQDAPLFAQAGAIIAGGGSLAAAHDALYAAKIKQETGRDLPMIKASDAAAKRRDQFGTAFSRAGDVGGLINEAAYAIAKTRIFRAGLDPDSREAKTIYERALQEAAGARFVDGRQYGGVASYSTDFFSGSHKVHMPADVRADRFRDVIQALRDSDLIDLPVRPQTAAGKFYTARDLTGAVPVRVNGGYRFAMGDPSGDDPKWVRGADGNPFVLPFDQLAPALRQRAPGAFLGGS